MYLFLFLEIASFLWLCKWVIHTIKGGEMQKGKGFAQSGWHCILFFKMVFTYNLKVIACYQNSGKSIYYHSVIITTL